MSDIPTNLPPQHHTEFYDEFEPMPFWFGLRMALGYSAQFLYVGLYLPYFPLWLKARELTPFQISTVLSMSLVIRVLASGQVMVFADRTKDRATLLSILMVGSAMAVMLYIPAFGFWKILSVTILYNLFFNPVLPLLDAITLAGVRRFNADYGRIRIWGSLVFIIGNLGGGILLAGFNENAILIALIFSMILGAVISFAVPRIGRRRKFSKTPNEAITRKKLLSNPYFITVLLVSGIAHASHAYLYGFGSIYWESLNFSSFIIGLFWAIGVVSEIMLFQFSKALLVRLSSVKLIAIGCAGGVIRWALFPFIDEISGFLLLQILHGLSFGAVHIGTMHFIMEQVPEENIGAAQGTGYVLGGIVMGIAVFSSGPIYAVLEGKGFLIMAATCLVGLLILSAVNFTPKAQGPAD